ncbi:cytochrome c peroxidase [Pseudolabrys sp. FHR47]|uniref:cytochrome c peroxidase n=1 Tax=Pseudolabrys sp. FHR47 TaxID=2562284 RepID=UPI0010BF26C9|nr:cytochrome c peroxidase [Pseudolabrys sp. FHR47]
MKAQQAILSIAIVATLVAAVPAGATPVISKDATLPVGSELNAELLDQPTELFSMEAAGGKRSYLFNLGDMLFSSSAIFGGKARDAGMSCNSCHQQGASNAKLFVPGHSTKPGTFDTSGPFFNPKADNGIFDPVTVPSLRGDKYLAPYGHDGRIASLREFIRNVIVNEFAGAEPSGQVLDALVTYVNEISFLPNGKITSDGKLTAKAPDAARRGETVFNKPFRHDVTMSCATCHIANAAFVDRKVHDVGSGGFFKTKTLLNAKFNAPYFHDGRYDSLSEVVAHFDQHFDLGLSPTEREDLVAYLDTVGDADRPFTPNTVQAEIDELTEFASVLNVAISARDIEIVALTVDSVGAEWREVAEKFTDQKDTSVEGGLPERLKARAAVRDMVLTLRRIAMAAQADDFPEALRIYAEYKQTVAAVTPYLTAAEPWSLYNPAVHDRHFSALRRLAELAK